jgi:hypothetical protein
VTALISGIVISNIIPENFPRISGRGWPSRTPAMALIADISLGTFLAMSLMSMQLWTLIDLALPILTILAAQFVVVAALSLLVVFRFLGRSYDAAVVSAGFGGYALGATPGGHGQHVSGDHPLWRFAHGVHYRAAGRRLLYRPGQCPDDPVLSHQLLDRNAHKLTTKNTKVRKQKMSIHAREALINSSLRGTQ